MRINGFHQISGFYSIVFSQEYDFKPQHISLYVFLLNQNNRNNWVEWFKCPIDLGMTGSCIGSKKTYYACLDDLQTWGLLKYEKGENMWKAPKISLVVLKSTSTYTSTYTSTIPQSEPLPEPLPTPIYKPSTLNLKPKTIQVFDFSEFGIFIPLVEKWIEYKNSRKENYKSQASLNAFVKILTKYSENKFENAENIIEQSMANNWAGIFKPKPEFNKFENKDTSTKLAFKGGKSNN